MVRYQLMTYDVRVLRVGNKIINYVYIIMDRMTKQAAIVDPAWDMDAICYEIEKNNLQVKMILLTHSHSDHVQLVEPLVARYNPKVYISKREADYYRYHSGNLVTLADQTLLMLGETPIRSILTPGHTAGGMCYLMSHSLFTGDTLFIEGCGICDTKGGNPYEMFASLKKIRQITNPTVSVYPGHSFGRPPGLSMEDLMTYNIYFQINDLDSFVKFRMRPNQRLNNKLFNFH